MSEEVRELDKQLTRLAKHAAPRPLIRFRLGPQTNGIPASHGWEQPEMTAQRVCPCRFVLGQLSQRFLWDGLWASSQRRRPASGRQRTVDHRHGSHGQRHSKKRIFARRTREGFSKQGINRCLKRYIVRELSPRDSIVGTTPASRDAFKMGSPHAYSVRSNRLCVEAQFLMNFYTLPDTRCIFRE